MDRIFRGWSINPPTHHLVAWIASYLGWDPERSAIADPADPTTSFPPQFIVGDNDNRMPPVTFDLEELRARNEEAMLRIVARNEARRTDGAG